MFNDAVIILPPAFLPPPLYYAVMLGARRVVIDTEMAYNKRAKSVHRTLVTQSHGPKFLTVPVSHPESSRTTWSAITVSDHNQWWSTMTSTLATIYGSTPFFEYYRDDFEKLLSEKNVGESITTLDLELDALIRRILKIPTRLSTVLDSRDASICDLRNADFRLSEIVTPEFCVSLVEELNPSLSIIEYLFNLGADETSRLLRSSVVTPKQ